MTLDELKENISSSAKQYYERFKETNFYHQLNDRFENMKASQQKVAIAAAAVISLIVLLFYPVTSFFESASLVGDFQSQREIIRSLINIQREIQEAPNLPEPPAADSIRSLAEAKIKEFNLLPEQIKSIESDSANSRLIPEKQLQSGLKITLNKVNIRQIVDIGAALQAINPSVKMLDMIIDPNATDKRYHDVVFRLVSLNIPKPPPPPPMEPEKKPTRKRNNNNSEEETTE